MKKWILFAFVAPWALTVAWPWVLLLWAIRAVTLLEWEEGGVLTAELRPWAAKIWRYSTTLGRGIIYQPDCRAPRGVPTTRIQRHERVHVRQTEDLMMLSFVVGLVVALCTGAWWLWPVLWWSGGMWQLPNFITAMLRGGNAYRDSEHERAAYGETDLHDESGRSWADDHPL